MHLPILIGWSVVLEEEMNKYLRKASDLIHSKSFITRVMSASILLPIVMAFIMLGGYLFAWFLAIVALILAVEWERMIRNLSKDHSILMKWRAIGFLYIITPIAALFFIRFNEHGLVYMLWMLLIVIATDVGAYITGLIVGGPKLAPSISPKKSWAGLFGGVVLASFTGVVFSIFQDAQPIQFWKYSPILSVVSQVGDLLESYFKRQFGVKDSSNLIPGHGGLFDRMDSIITSAIFVAILIV